LSIFVSQTIPYIPSHLDYMLYELTKNAARAVVEHHHTQQNGLNSDPDAGIQTMSGAGDKRRGPSPALPPIHICICASGPSARDLTLKISDQGGGIPAALVDQVYLISPDLTWAWA
jgi:[3-methyl-2-oxobutanoate dehydrogenase (acetyl-transferring)] kinase